VVFLNGHFVGAQSFPHVNYTNPPSIFSTSNAVQFLTGQNVLEIRCFNQPGGFTNPTGIDFSAVVVPEPSVFVLTGAGLAGLFLTYRRRQRA
jgi:hypothetical protein